MIQRLFVFPASGLNMVTTSQSTSLPVLQLNVKMDSRVSDPLKLSSRRIEQKDYDPETEKQ